MKSHILKVIALITLFTAGGFSSLAQNNGSALSSANNPVSPSTAFAVDKNIISVEISDLVDKIIYEYASYPDYAGGGPNAWSPHFWTIKLIMAEGTDITSLAPIITLAPGATITSKHADVQDFSQQVEYTVICEDGSTVAYFFSAYAQDNMRANYTLFVECNPSSGAGSTSLGATHYYDENYPVLCIASPYISAYSFKRWLLNGSQKGTSEIFHDYIPNNYSVLIAEFEPIPVVYYTVSVYSENQTIGTVSGGGTVAAGGSVWVYATPNSGNSFESYAFEGWYLFGSKLSGSASFSYKPYQNCTLTAKFVTQYTVTVQSEDLNKGYVNGGGTVNAGGFLTVIATPFAGYTFEGWYLNGSKISGTAMYSYFPTTNSTLIAKFKPSEISGPSTVCYNGSSFSLPNPPSGTIYWTVSNTNIFSVTSSGNPTTVTRKGTSNSSVVLSARTGSVSGPVIATKTITPCTAPSISGPSSLGIGSSHTFTVSNPPSGFTWGNSSHLTPVSGTPGRFTGTSSGQGWVSIMFNGNEIVRHYVAVGSLYISGPDGICHAGGLFSASQSATWSVSYGFSLESTTGTTARVISDGTQSSGTLTAVANGITVYKTFLSCLFDGTLIPSTEYIYWSDIGCGDHLELDPPRDQTYDNSYKWVDNGSSGANFSFYPCCTYQRSVDVYFTGNGGYANLHAYRNDGSGNFTELIFVYYISTINCGRSSPDDHETREIRDIHDKCVPLETDDMCDMCDISESPLIQVTIFPNPVSGVLTVEINVEDFNNTGRQSSALDVRLYDWQGRMVRQTSTQGGTVQFDVSNLPEGVYYIHVYDGVNPTPEVHQVVVER